MKAARFNLGVYLLCGVPFFYLLTFVGDADESAADVMVWAGLVGVGWYLMDLTGGQVKVSGQQTAVVAAGATYFVYAVRVLPGLRVFKPALRGYGYLAVGRLTPAVGVFRRALALDAASPLAARGMLALHHSLSLAAVEKDPELIDVLDFNLCLDRAQDLLVNPSRTPTPAERAEAVRFLELVELKYPALQARTDYLRAVERVHAKDFDAAAGLLRRLFDPEVGYAPGRPPAGAVPGVGLGVASSPRDG